jgi:uncharacterized protein (TIGR00730 family)
MAADSEHLRFLRLRHGAGPRFRAIGRQLGEEMARSGIGLVYGGGALGLMGTVARAVIARAAAGSPASSPGSCTRELQFDGAHEMIVTTDMHERKRLMFEKADAFVALPGGIGTLEELVEQMTWSQLGQHAKPILIADIGHFWKPLLVLLAHMREAGFIREDLEIHYLVAERVAEILPMLDRAAATASLRTERASA